MSNSSKFIQIQYYQSPVGEIVLGSYDNALCLSNWRYGNHREHVEKRIAKALKSEYVEETSAVIEETKKQLGEYFLGQRDNFDIPLLMLGTDFQKSVWQALLKIPFGKTDSYLEQARSIGKEKAVRAVASANGANAISILIPCHRIIGSDGALTGYAGGLETKKMLLDLETASLMRALRSK
ncbi:MAG TPA: methylated-DNA--[protein]-cysteine S-methyltransferase [Sulfurovum sp.]|nr:methylated-DNA--[protein]-cysteine S-methyltransferase [Sulfurovum sp.]